MAKVNVTELVKAAAAAIDEKVKTTLKEKESMSADDFLPLAETLIREAFVAGKQAAKDDASV